MKLAIGPSIDEGWYYDMDAPFAFTPEHLGQIEGEMRKICKEKLKLERFELPRPEAALGEEEGEAGALVPEHKQAKLLAQAAGH